MTQQFLRVKPAIKLCISLILAATLFAFSGSTSSHPLISIPFDGKIEPAEGGKLTKNVAIEYENFRKRKVLRLEPMKHLVYQLTSGVPQEATMKFWIKPDSAPTDSQRTILRLSSAGGSSLDVLLIKKSLELNVRRSGMKYAQVYRFEGNEFVRGQWTLMAIQWNKNALKALRDGKEIELQSTNPPAGLNFSKAAQLEVGSPTKVPGEDEDDFAADLRDLQIW